MVNKEPQNCWEYWNCVKKIREDCVAYKRNFGKKCWMVAGSNVDKKDKCPKVKNLLRGCWECLWFKKLNPDSDY